MTTTPPRVRFHRNTFICGPVTRWERFVEWFRSLFAEKQHEGVCVNLIPCMSADDFVKCAGVGGVSISDGRWHYRKGWIVKPKIEPWDGVVA